MHPKFAHLTVSGLFWQLVGHSLMGRSTPFQLLAKWVSLLAQVPKCVDGVKSDKFVLVAQKFSQHS
jgi:hypothetical protein